MPNRLKNRIFVVLATLLVAMIPHVAVAQSPATCDPKDRITPGDYDTPCRPQEVQLEITSVSWKYHPTLADVREDPEESYCQAQIWFEFSVSPSLPEGVTQLNVDSQTYGARRFAVGVNNIREGNRLGHVIMSRTLQDHYRDAEIDDYRFRDFYTSTQYDELSRTTDSRRLTAHYNLSYNGKDFPQKIEGPWVDLPIPKWVDVRDELNLCVSKLALEYEKLQETTRLKEQEERTRRAEELKEMKSANDLAIAKEIETISARIDALRLRVAKQIDVNVVELNLVRERTTTAAIEIDREITAIEIDTKRKYMQSLEDTARWINEWVLEKQDQWDDLAELQSQWKQRITEYQAETAQVIQDLEAKRAEIESSIAESERRQRELEAQIRDSQIDTSQLEAQLEAAQAELKAAQERLEELED